MHGGSEALHTSGACESIARGTLLQLPIFLSRALEYRETASTQTATQAGQGDNQTDRQTNRETERQTDRQTDRETDRRTDGRTDR